MTNVLLNMEENDKKIRGIIYKYTSPSNKIYVGQTIREQERKAAFLRKNKRYSGPKIEAARKKYGPENFKYEVIFVIESSNKDEVRNILNEKEKYFIGIFDSIKNGYNLDEGGAYKDSEHTKPVSEETIKKRSEAMKKLYANGYKIVLSEEAIKSIKNKLSIPIIQYTIKGEFIREWESAAEAGRVLGVKPSLITKVCKKQNQCCRQFVFVYKSEYPDVPKQIDTSYLPKRILENPERYKNGKARKVLQYDLQGELINTFNSLKEAGKLLNYSDITLGKYCRGKNNHIYKNFKFVYG